MQQASLQQKSQPMEQLDEVVEGDQGVDVEVSNRSGQHEEAGQKGACMSSRDDAAEAAKQRSRETTPRESLGSRWISAMLESS
jgi:hypothetical protein